MDDATDQLLLARFLAGDRDEAFRALVERHSGMVYGCARRIIGDHAAAEDISQAVFLLLIRKAPTLKNHGSLAGWLYRTTSLTARDALRRTRRREVREQHGLSPEPESDRWEQVAGYLDACMERLSETDRHALLLRYFEHRSLKEVGGLLRLSDDTAQKRVSRALDRLRGLLVDHGVQLTAIDLATLVAQHGAAGVSAATKAALLAAGSAAATTTSVSAGVLLKNTLQALLMKNLKIAAVSLLIALPVGVGVTGYVIQTRTAGWGLPASRGGSPRQLLADLAEAARAHDGTRLAAAVHVTDPDRRRRLGILAEWINATGEFDRACRKAFGDGATDAAFWNSSPPLLYRLEFGQENLGTALETVTGSKARVDILRAWGVWQFIEFQKIDGVWKIWEDAVDDVAAPEQADQYARLTPGLRALSQEVAAATLQSANDAKTRLVAITSESPAPR
jgi:RNA polymerase sigma factor (sigma-70 family)